MDGMGPGPDLMTWSLRELTVLTMVDLPRIVTSWDRERLLL